MADQKLTQLTAVTSATTDALLYVVDTTVASKKITFDNLQKSITTILTSLSGAAQLTAGVFSTFTFVDNEVVSGSGTSFTLANTPIAGSVKIYALGQRLIPTNDYTISGTGITTINSWSSGDLQADYRK
jgi:hypothetical protein